MKQLREEKQHSEQCEVSKEMENNTNNYIPSGGDFLQKEPEEAAARMGTKRGVEDLVDSR